MDGETRTRTAEELLGSSGWLRALAARLVADPATADDLVQETVLAALDRPAGEGPAPRSWLARVLSSRARDERNSRRSRARRERLTARAEHEPDPAEISARLEQQKLIVEAVQRLDEPLRSTAVLRWFDGLSAADIARRTGVPAGTVRWRSSRALEELRKDLDERHGGDRAAWLAALAPFAAPYPVSTTAGGLAAALGGTLMGMKGWTLATLTVVVLGSLAWLARDPELGPEVPVTAIASSGGTSEVDASTPPSMEIDRERRDSLSRAPASADAVDDLALSGRVAWPTDLGPDTELRVFALSAPMDYGPFVESRERRRRDDDRGDGALLASAPVAPDGTFSLAVPHGALVHLMLRGRFLYLPSSIPHEVDGTELVLEPTVGAHLTGRLRGPADTDVAETRIALAREREVTSSSRERFDLDLRTDEEGRFTLAAVPAGMSFTLLVRPDELAAKLETVTALAPAEERDLELVLERGGHVSGWVVDEGGHPIADAEVQAQLGGGLFGSDGFIVSEAASRADGAFELSAVPSGRISLRARGAGRLETRRITVELPPEGTHAGEHLVLSTGRAVHGRVVWPDGEPARGVRIELSFDPAFATGATSFNALRGARGSTTSGEDGRFAVTGLGEGPFVLSAEVERDGVLHRARRDGVRPAEGLEADEHELLLRPPLAIAGRVVDPRGTAVDAFTLRATRIVMGELGESASRTITRAFEGTAGSFELEDLVEGRWELAARTADAVMNEPVRVDLPAHGALELVVHAAASASGRVVDDHGRPIAGARVRLDQGRTRLQREVTGLAPGAEVETDADGRFELGGLPPGDRALAAEADGWVGRDPLVVTLVEGGRVEGLELVLGPGATLTGEVWESGEPAIGRVVNLVQWKQAQSYDALLTTTDGDGRFRYDAVRPGTWIVLALDPASDLSAGDDGDSLASVMGAMKFTQVVLREGETAHAVLGTQPDVPVEVVGRVLGSVTAGGEPVEVLVNFHPVSGQRMKGATTTSNPDGTFRVTLPRPGDWIVAVQGMSARPDEQRFVEFRRSVEADGGRIELRLPTGTISGTVLAADGTPAVGAPVNLVPAAMPRSDSLWGGQYATLTTDEEGRFEVRYLDPGTYVLSVGGSSFGGATFLEGTTVAPYARVNRAVELSPGEAMLEVEMQLPVPGAVRVFVRGPDGEPVDSATVFVRGEDGSPIEGFSNVRTDSDGFATYSGLPPGQVTLRARAGNRASLESGPVTIRSEGLAAAELVLVDATLLEVRLRGPDGPIPAGLSVFDSADREVAAVYGLEDVERLFASDHDPTRLPVGPLPPGRYRLVAEGEGGLTGEKSVTVRGAPEQSTTVRLK